MRRLTCVATVCLALGARVTTARAYGPMTHMGEARTVVDRLQTDRVSGLSAVADQVDSDNLVRMHLYLGAFLPDMREAADSIAFPTHSREFAHHLLQLVATDPAVPMDLRAVALGLACHVASDIAAQLYATPYFAAIGGVGAADVFIDLMDNRPDGENELLVEAILDVYYGDVDDFLALYDHFQPNPPAPQRVDRVLDFWLGEAEVFFGAGQIGDASAIKTEIHDTLRSVAEELTPSRRQQLIDALALVREYFPLADVVVMADSLGLMDSLITGGREVELDVDELLRLREVSPFFGDSRHFDDYPVWLNQLGPTILTDSAQGDPWLENWPTWRAEPLAAATIQSLAGLLDPPFEVRGDVTLFDLWWEDASTDVVLTSLNATDLPSRVRLVAELFPLAQVAEPFRLQVRKAIPDAEYIAGGVQARTTVDPGWSPLLWHGEHPERLELEFDLDDGALRHTDGFHAELVTASATGVDRVFFTTDWSVLDDLAGWDLSRPVYANQFSTWDHWPQSLRLSAHTADTSRPEMISVEVTPERLPFDAPELHITLRAHDVESSISHYLVSVVHQPRSTPGTVYDLPQVAARGGSRDATLIWEAAPEHFSRGAEVTVSARAVNFAGMLSDELRSEPVVLVRAKDDGCDCQSAPGTTSLWFFLLLGWLGRRWATTHGPTTGRRDHSAGSEASRSRDPAPAMRRPGGQAPGRWPSAGLAPPR